MLFSFLAENWEKIEKTSLRLEIADIFSYILQSAKKEDIRPIIYLSNGMLLPSHEGLELGIGINLMFDALALSSGYKIKDIEKKFKEKGDIGEVSEELISKKLQSTLYKRELEVVEVYNSLVNIAKLQGKGSQELKIKQICELLNFCSPLEAKYLARLCVGNMRLGIGEPTMIDAIAKIKISQILKTIKGIEIEEKQQILFENFEVIEKEDLTKLNLKVKINGISLDALEQKKCAIIYEDNKKTNKLKILSIKEIKENEYEIVFEQFKKTIRYPIERAFNLCNDLGKVAYFSLFDWEKIEKFKIELFSPIRPALAERLTSAQEIIEKIGPCAADAKYDGFRLQIHKKGKKVELYSRKLERVTDAFPEIRDAISEFLQKELIIEGEAIAYNKEEKKYYPFQITIKRKRKYDIEKMKNRIPLHLFVFDLLYVDGTDYTNIPFEKRRQELEKIIKEKDNIFLSELLMVSNAKELENFFEKCIKKGLEGVIAKDLSAPYVAGAREFAWIKLKKSYGKMADTIDAVIVGYYLGKGQRVEFNFGGLLVALKNTNTNMLETIAKIGSGFSEQEMEKLEKILSKIKIKEKPPNLISNIKPDFWVEPKIVITVSADEISLSPIHTCNFKNNKGFALRFPRMVAIREDKGVDDITTTDEIIRLYNLQQKKLS
jgi:DNA ligase-1